jgi:hypothetical protein
MTSDITSGLVRIEDGVKRAEEYAPPRKVVIELRFENANGTDYRLLLEQASNAANAKVAELLGTKIVAAKPPTPRKQEPAAPLPPTQATHPAEASAVTAAPASVTQGGDAGPIPDHLKRTADPAAMAISTGDERHDPAAMPDVMTSQPKEVTDVELTTAIGRKNGETKNTPAIRALIGRYVPQDGKVHQAAEIEQGKRGAFLIELAKVPKV